MLIDEVELVLTAGKGGNGKAAFYPHKNGPCGGDGGNGGNVYVQAKKEVTTLNHIADKKSLAAEDGMHGENYMKTGRDGKDLVIYVPLHTEVENKTNKSKRIIEEYETKYLLCRGGSGGRGNDAFKSATNRTPTYAEKGFPGQTFSFVFILKLIADVGLIGLPNAGKSTLLNLVTNANVRTAPYPFTTLEPNLGALGNTIIADIPGLIEGASKGRGLGTRFLKHIEKVKVLIHCISLDSQSITKDYQTIRTELGTYNPALLEKPEIVLLTKSDLIGDKTQIKKTTKTISKETHKPVFAICLVDQNSADKVGTILNQAVQEYAPNLKWK